MVEMDFSNVPSFFFKKSLLFFKTSLQHFPVKYKLLQIIFENSIFSNTRATRAHFEYPSFDLRQNVVFSFLHLRHVQAWKLLKRPLFIEKTICMSIFRLRYVQKKCALRKTNESLNSCALIVIAQCCKVVNQRRF